MVNTDIQATPTTKLKNLRSLDLKKHFRELKIYNGLYFNVSSTYGYSSVDTRSKWDTQETKELPYKSRIKSIDNDPFNSPNFSIDKIECIKTIN